MLRRAVLMALIAASCGDKDVPSEIGPAPSIDDVPVSQLPPFEIDTHELDAMLAEANTAIARWHTEKRPGLPPEFAEPGPELTAQFAAATIPRLERSRCIPNAVPIGDGWIAGLQFGRAWSFSSAFIHRTSKGIRIHERRPAEIDRRTRTKAVSGTAWLNRYRGNRMRLVLRIVVESDDRFARLYGSLFARGDCMSPQLDLAVHSMSVEGGGRWTSFAEHLFVETRGPGIPTVVTLDVQPIENKHVVLRDTWIPATFPGKRLDLDLVLAFDDHTSLFVPYTTPVRAPAGWRAARLRGLHEIPAFAATWEDTPPTTLQVRGAKVLLAGTIARCSTQVAALIERLPGLAPFRDLAIVETQAGFSTVPYVGGVIVIEPQWGLRICGGVPTATAVLLHEVAHAWCPGRTPGDHLAAARICESIANYAAASVATPAELAALFEKPAHPVYAVGIARRVAVPDRDDTLISYQKGPLVLRAVEREIGAEKMQAVLRDFFNRWRDQVVSWEDFARSVEIVVGPEAAADARRRFVDPAWPESW